MDKVDEQLWQQIVRTVPTRQPPPQMLPLQIAIIDGLKVKVVNFDIWKVKPRPHGDMDLVEAGNGYRWPFIPKDEVWLDDNLQAHEFWPNTYHETFEVRLMRGGLAYNPAHERANKMERLLRLRMAHATSTGARALR